MASPLSTQVKKFLEEPNVGILATVSPAGRIQATPVWFLVEADHILINTSKGRLKLRNLEQHPYLALTVVDPKNMYRYVQLQGRAVRFDPATGARDIDRLSHRYQGQAYSYPASDRPENRISILIRPLRASGMGLN